MATKIDTVTARAALKARGAAYWHKIRKDCHLGYRKLTKASQGTWVARFRDHKGNYQLHSLGAIDNIPAHQRFDEAAKHAEIWFTHRITGGSPTKITVEQACKRFVQKRRDEGNEKSAHDLEKRFQRVVYSDAEFSQTYINKLTSEQTLAWRVRLANKPILLQDKSKTTDKKRKPSSLNRDMAPVKAALNLAKADGYTISDNAWRQNLLPVPNASSPRTIYLSKDERIQLVQLADPEILPFLKALSQLPLRPGAIAALTAGQFEEKVSEIRINKDKNGRQRMIKLPKNIADFFAEQIKNKKPDEPIFQRKNGTFWNKDSWYIPIKDAAKAADLPEKTSAYTMRHSTITDLIALHKLDILTVATLADTSIKMIEKHYGHLLKDHAADALANLAI